MFCWTRWWSAKAGFGGGVDFKPGKITGWCLMKTDSPLSILPERFSYRPLDVVTITAPGDGTVAQVDGCGVVVSNREVAAGEVVPCVLGGALGCQRIVFTENITGRQWCGTLRVEAQTGIEDEEGVWRRFHEKMVWNIHRGERSNAEYELVRHHGRTYTLYSCWLRDNVHVIQGKKWYAARLKDALDLYAANQTENGMLYDFYMDLKGAGAGDRYRDPQFTRLVPEDHKFFQRVPVENDVEYLFVQGIWEVWKASGDHGWMCGKLAHAEKALRYNLTSPYCWSDRFQLIKRAFTIDTWDFMPQEEAARVGGDVMEVWPEVTRFGIFHGDNTGFASACAKFAEMLEVVGRGGEAEEWRRCGEAILERLNRLAWRDGFYEHWVPEDGVYPDSYGVDLRRQISLSNSYALNRGIDLARGRELLGTYRRLRDGLDAASPAEFFGIYPPFEAGFQFKTWHYVNGGVWPFVGGQLARGAFELGDEAYGVDILRRLDVLLEKHDNEFPYYYIGRHFPAPERRFEPLDLCALCNVDISGEKSEGVPAWQNRGTDNDFGVMPTGRLCYHEVPVEVAEREANGHRVAIGLALPEGYAEEVVVPVGRQVAALYFLHTLAGGAALAGWFDWTYADGTTHRQFVERGRHIQHWWNPRDVPYNRVAGWQCRVAFSGRNQKTLVGNYLWGVNNPHPTKEVASIRLVRSGVDAWWFVFGITVSDQPVWFPAAETCGGWFYNWNTAGVVYGLMEGLCGVVNTGVALETLTLSPRWSATATSRVRVTAHLPESDSYVAYEWERRADGMAVTFTGSMRAVRLRLLLPQGREAKGCLVDGHAAETTIERVADSAYVCLDLVGGPIQRVEVEW